MNRREFLSTVCVAALTTGWKHGVAGGGGSSLTWTTINPTAPFTDGIGILASPPAGSRVIHVANGGTDANVDNAGSVAAPFATIEFASNYIRTSKPDQMLLKKGDVFNANSRIQPILNGVAPSPTSVPGNTITGPILIGSYGAGTTRPRVDIPYNGAPFYNSTGNSSVTTSNFAIIGIEMYAYDRDGTGGSLTLASVQGGFGAPIANFVGGDWCLIEDCKISYFTFGIDWEAPYYQNYTNFMVRGCQIVGCYSGTGGRSQGAFVASTQVLMEYNLFDLNGWNNQAAVIALVGSAVQQQDTNHNVYCSQDCLPSVFRQNIFSNDGGGNQFRQGGDVNDNLFVQNAIAMVIGRIGGTVTGNFIWNSTDVPGTALGWGIDINPSKGGAATLVSGNVCANSVSVGGGHGIFVDQSFQATGRFTSGLTLVDCISNQGGPQGGGTGDGEVGFENGYYMSDNAIPSPHTYIPALTTWSGTTYFPPGGFVEITNASPAVVTYHSTGYLNALVDGVPFTFGVNAGLGTLPAQLTAGVVYYVRNPTNASGTTAWNVSATPTGALINTSGGSGIFNANTGQLTMSNAANATGTDIQFAAVPQLVTVSNNIIFAQAQPTGTTWDQGVSTTITNNNIDAAGNNNVAGGPGHPNPYPNPTISIGAYSTSVGGSGTITDFLAQCAAQKKDAWNNAYTAAATITYLKTGFGL